MKEKKAAQKGYRAKYESSAKGKANRNSDKAKNSKVKYNATDKGKATMSKMNAKRPRKREEQAGRPKPDNCEICGVIGKICFDHDHATGLFRGWICNGCNSALGHTHDNPEILKRLARYLEGRGYDENNS